MAEDLKTWEKLTKNVIKTGFEKTINDLTTQLSKEPKYATLYFFRTMMNIQNDNFKDAGSDIDNAKKYSSELPSMKDYFLKSGLIFSEYVKNNPKLDYAEKFINLKRAEYSCNFALWTSEDKETKTAVRKIKQLQKEFRMNNKENLKTLNRAMNKMCKLYKLNKYQEAIKVGTDAVNKIGNHPHLIDNINAINKKIA